jgi:threonine dehydratase
MAIKNLTAPKTFVAGGTITENQLVKLHSVAGQVVAAGAGEAAIGVAQNAAAAGEEVSIEMTPGAIVKVKASAAISLGALLEAAADGEVVTATAAATTLPTDGARQNILGRALEAATADGDVIAALWAPYERI